MNKVILLEGLDCASCASELEEILSAVKGVSDVSVDFIGQKVRLDCADENVLAEVIKRCNDFEDVKVVGTQQGRNSSENSAHESCCKEHARREGSSCGCGHAHAACGNGHKHGSACCSTQGAAAEKGNAGTLIKREIQLENIDCASCASELEELVAGIDGVENAAVDFIAQKVRFECADDATVEEVKKCCAGFEEVRVVEPAETSEGNERKIKIKGLCCANCGRELEEILNKIDGVSAVVDFVNSTIKLKCASDAAYEQSIYQITHFEDVKIDDEKKPAAKSLARQHMREIIQIVVSAVFFVPALILNLVGGKTGVIVSYPLFAVSYLSVGWEVLVNTVKNISKGRIFDENFLMTIASLAAIVLGIFSGDGIYEGVAVMLLYQLGELLQSIAVGSSRNSIAKLMDLKSDTATVLRGGQQVVIKPEELEVGDIMLIKAGEKVPADGVIVKGESSLDMRSLNGESLPADVKEGQEILSGAINISKVLEVKVIRKYSDSAVAKILDLVENSTAKKAAPEKFITKFAKYYTPAVCAAALIVAAVVPTIICAVNGLFAWATYSTWISKALSFLVISCPCALVISVPLSYFGGIGRCAKFGILAKGSTCLDELALATVAAFDKTGTITEGSFKIIKSSSEEAVQIAAAAEKYSSHPIAVAFSSVTSKYSAENAEEVAGRGVKCTIGGKTALCGNAVMMKENGVEIEQTDSIYTVIYVALDGRFVGSIEIGDGIKPDAKAAIAVLKAQGVTYCTMLTGDNPARAAAVAKEVGLDGYEAGLLPDGKLEKAEQLKQRGKLIYVGDGINDAPVMAAADCAVSMGKVGSDAAIEASDVVLVTDNLELLPKGKKIARATRSIVFQNIIGSLLVKLAVMVLGIAIPSFPLILAVVADVGVMLVAVLNAMRTKLVG
ncbi:MAG TPA: cadmium-translocating P-type ATPase [Candidatus Coproplasma excrementavium]|nr:cadmium-translocating P-type ATPase [Candidatus Coproplasma excrementavium]